MHALADELVDLDKIESNDIYAILSTYGVEAARAAVIQEVSSVFGAYAIAVDYRHLTIIADYMVSTLLALTSSVLTRRHTQVDTDRSTERVFRTSRPLCSRRLSRRLSPSCRKLCFTETLTTCQVLPQRSSWVNQVRAGRARLISGRRKSSPRRLLPSRREDSAGHCVCSCVCIDRTV